MRSSIAALVVLGACLTPAAVAAQERTTPRRLWASAGLGYGLMASDEWGQAGGVTGALAIAWRMSRNVRVGVAAHGWLGEAQKADEFGTLSGGQLVAAGTPSAWIYPFGRAGFFLLGGAGLGLRSTGLGGGVTGPAALVGLGYEAPRRSEGPTVAPFLNTVWLRGAHFFDIGVAVAFGSS